MAKSKPKYTTLTQLHAAFQSGELDREVYYLVLDKSGNDITLQSRDDPDKDCSTIFNHEYGTPLVELFSLLGIDAEWC